MRRRNGRVEVSDLSAPERIRPGPLKRDIFQRPAQAPINNDLQRLSSALGIAGRGLASLAAQTEAANKKEEFDRRIAEYNTYISSTKQSQVLDDIRNGKVPYHTDPYIGSAVRKDFGTMEARALAGEVDTDISSGAIPFGTQNFNPEEYLLKKAAPLVSRLSGSKESIGAFRRGLESLRNTLTGKHQKALGVAVTRRLESIASRSLDQAIVSGVANGVSGTDLMGELRKVYKELGPRVSGGSLDLKFGRLDDLLLDNLDKRAEDPKYARQVIELLKADRIDSGSGLRLGALSQSQRHGNKVRQVFQKALGALSKEAETAVKGEVLKQDVEALNRRDGSGLSFQDFKQKNPIDGDKEITLSGSSRQEEAVKAFIASERAKSGGAPTANELQVIISNGIKHPQIIPAIESAVNGFLNTNLTGPPKKGEEGEANQRFQQIAEAAQLYNTLADTNFQYAEKFVSKRARDFFETYTALTRYGIAKTPQEAAATVARIYSSEANEKGGVRSIPETQVVSAIEGINWVQGSWDPTIRNTSVVATKVREIAQLYMRAGGVSQEDALKLATERLQKGSVIVNGHVIFGQPGLEKGDSAVFNSMFEDIYKKHGKFLSEYYGIDSAADLTVMPYRNGVFELADGNRGLPIRIPDNGAERPQLITFKDVLKLRQAAQKKSVDKAVNKVIEKRNRGDEVDRRLEDFREERSKGYKLNRK